MDIFTLEDNGVDSYDNGAIVNTLDEKLWVERFREPGIFEFKCTPSEYVMNILATGTLISHARTPTVMMVEDHEITVNRDKDPVLKISGRSVDGFLDYRAATDNAMGFSPPLYDGTSWPYTLAEAFPWTQARTMLRQQITSSAVRTSFILPHVTANHDIVLETIDKINHPDWFDTDEREIERGPLSGAIRSILHEIDAGIKTIRPGWANNGNKNLQFVIAQGADIHDRVSFSFTAGDLDTARYFWSIRPERNGAYVLGQFAGVYVNEPDSGLTGWAKKVTVVNADDFKPKPGTAGWSSPTNLARLDAMLERRGRRALRRRNEVSLVEATIAPTNSYRYRTDYDLGDIVWVKGDYGVSKKMRITEFAETEDATGEVGFPTLSNVNA